jgi:hypothetical protein
LEADICPCHILAPLDLRARFVDVVVAADDAAFDAGFESASEVLRG